MKVPVSIILIFVVALPCAAAEAQKTATATPKSTIQALAKKLEAEAKRWEKDLPLSAGLKQELARIKYDEQSLSALEQELSVRRKQPVRLFVTNRLLSPLPRCNVEIIRKSVRLVRRMQAKFQYKNVPQYSPQQLKRISLPEEFPKNLSTQVILRQIAIIQKRYNEKAAKDEAVSRFNKEVMALDKLYATLLLLSDKATNDTKFNSLITQSEQRGLLTFTVYLRILGQHAPKMKKERVEKFYKQLETTSDRLMLKKAHYFAPYYVIFSRTSNSGFFRQLLFTCHPFLTTMNKLAPLINKPVRKLPTAEELDKRRAKARIR